MCSSISLNPAVKLILHSTDCSHNSSLVMGVKVDLVCGAVSVVFAVQIGSVCNGLSYVPSAWSFPPADSLAGSLEDEPSPPCSASSVKRISQTDMEQNCTFLTQ